MLLFSYLGQKLAHFLAKPHDREDLFPTSNPSLLKRTLRKGDILLVEGTSHFSTSIKYLSQSTWSHAALYIGDHLSTQEELDAGIEPMSLLEADIEAGVRVIPLSTYAHLHSRICRPVGLSESEINRVIQFAVTRLGDSYDLKNIFDLARYLIPTPPIPARWRRKALVLGSGDPTQAICSSLIAQAFQSIKYPILPDIIYENPEDTERISHYQQVHRRRDPSLFTPRDFDVSPYFEVIKPMVQSGFDHHAINWVEPHPAEEATATHEIPVMQPVTTSLQAQADMEAAAVPMEQIKPDNQA